MIFSIQRKPPFGVSYQIVVPSPVRKSREFSDLMKKVLKTKLTGSDYNLLPMYRAKAADMRAAGQAHTLATPDISAVTALMDNINDIHEDLMAYILLSLDVRDRQAQQENEQ